MKLQDYSNKSIADLLRNVAAVYLLKGENRFRMIAYEKAADTVEHLSRELKDIWQEGRLKEVPGFGAAIGSHLDELFAKGESTFLNEVFQGIPSSIFVLMKIPSLGPKKAFKLVQTLELLNEETVIEDLKKAAQENKIATIPSFGEKSQADILHAIELYQRKDRREDRMPLPYAMELAEEIIAFLKKHPGVEEAVALGSMRRRVSTIGDIDIAVMSDEKDSQSIVDHFITYPGKIAIDNSGNNKASIIAVGNIRVDLRIQSKNSFGPMLQYFTGSKAHNIKLREYALKKGLSLSEWGIKRVKSSELRDQNSEINHTKNKVETIENSLVTFEKEEDFYGYLGLPYVPPEIREGTNEVHLAIQNKLPKLIEEIDMTGDFHTHSSYDLQPSHDFGQHSYEELMQKAISLGYKCIGFSDHNPKISGLSANEIIYIMKERKHYIDGIFTSASFDTIPYFIGLETDILPSGELALPEEAAEYVDYLIVSVHSSFMLPMKEMTERVLKALSYPKVKLLAHPTGRHFGKRDGYELDWNKIFAFVKEKNIALEINSAPQRLDLPDILVREGKERGVKFFINTDAHAVEHMDNMKYGVSVARRGWLEKEDVINAGSVEEITSFIK